MSIHGICFDNGQSGNCNIYCDQFQEGKCDAYEDVIDAHIDEVEFVSGDDIELFKQVYNYSGDGRMD